MISVFSDLVRIPSLALSGDVPQRQPGAGHRTRKGRGEQNETESPSERRGRGKTERASEEAKERGSASDRLLYSVLVRLPAGYLRRKQLTSSRPFRDAAPAKIGPISRSLRFPLLFTRYNLRVARVKIVRERSLTFGRTKCISCHARPCHRSAKFA